MEGCKLLAHHGAWYSTPKLTEKKTRLHTLKVVGVIARPNSAESTPTSYNDTWFDKIAIRHLSKSVQATTGITNNKEGYESLIEAAAGVSRNRSTIKQHQLVLEALNKAVPKPISYLIRTLLPPSKFTREFFAVFTTINFTWLVGPSQVKESELNGRKEINVAHIKKCRFLEGTNCVGMCINLCKTPTQKFIKDSFGIPLTMVPNFEDMSCDMIFGQEPPAASDDPAMTQPCYSICKHKRKHTECGSLESS